MKLSIRYGRQMIAIAALGLAAQAHAITLGADFSTYTVTDLGSGTQLPPQRPQRFWLMLTRRTQPNMSSWLRTLHRRACTRKCTCRAMSPQAAPWGNGLVPGSRELRKGPAG